MKTLQEHLTESILLEKTKENITFTLSDLMHYSVWNAIEDVYEDSIIEDLFDTYGSNKKDILNVNGYEVKCVLSNKDIKFTFLFNKPLDDQIKVINDIVYTLTETTGSMLGHEKDIKNMLKNL